MKMTYFQMGKTALKNLLSRPATILYPAEAAKKSNITRGHVENDIGRCIFCGNCQRKCPCVAITVERAAKSWGIDRFRCVTCGCCVEVCPVKCLRMDTERLTPTTDKGRKDILIQKPPETPKI